MDDMINALKVIIVKSPNAMREAIKTIQAINSKSPMAQKRYNHVASIALNDGAANFSDEERVLIVGCMAAEDGERGRPTLYSQTMRQTSIWMPEEMIAWLKEHGSLSEQIREMVAERMKKEI